MAVISVFATVVEILAVLVAYNVDRTAMIAIVATR